MRRFIHNDTECRRNVDADAGFEVEVVDAKDYDDLIAKLAKLLEENDRLQKENDANAWKVSPAMAQATIDGHWEKIQKLEAELAKVRTENAETCKWKLDGDLYWYIPCIDGRILAVLRGRVQCSHAFTHCPYCGRRIEEVKP